MKRIKRVVRVVLLNSVAGLSWLPRPARVALYRWCGVPVGERTQLHPGHVIRPGRIRIGSDCFINVGCIFDPGSGSIDIEDGVALAQRVILAGNTHVIGPESKRAAQSVSGDIRIGRGSWLGAGVIVLPGVTIASGCVVGAGSVVTRDTEPNGVYVGSPARRFRTLDDQA